MNLENRITILESQITSGNNAVTLFSAGADALETYGESIYTFYNDGYCPLFGFAETYPNFCSAENNHAIYYNQPDFNWGATIYTLCTEPVLITSSKSILFRYTSGAADVGEMWLVPKSSTEMSAAETARYTVEIIRKLKTLGITCYFEKEDLDTGDMKSEFILTTLAAVAQEESRTISENMRWSMEKRSPRGDVPNVRCYGYELSDEFETTETGYKRRKVVIVPDEAKIVKKIFMLYVNGKNITEITRILNGEKNPAPDPKYGWMKEKIRYILKNERYCGDVLIQKTYTEDFLTHKHKRNNGEIPQYYIKNHHPAIISRELFQKAQKRRKKDTNARKRNEYRYSGRLVCAHCGKNYAAIRERYSIFWKCSSAMLNNGMRICNVERISQIMLDLMLINAVDARFPDSGELIAKLESTQDLDFMERDRSIMKKQIAIAEMELDDAVKAYEELQNKIKVLKMRQEIFGEKTDLTSYLFRCDELKNTITTLEKEKSALESELYSKKKHWELLERDYAIRNELIEFLKTASEKELRNRLPCYVKALVLSIIVHDTEHFTVRWFDGTETDTTI